ncbi:uncharacterized protein LOC122255519 isoform X2 [Penaeus japonicus]|uniref:uncharacterized protein LOC122255519 isoform X2 n=1 Tax=Penaeus japonicus TaxID=27405 RepID=UPI001C71160C|nr:uncharacterized protein LOC122255519 isoform X2 [Penaeus japonicus]
MLWQASSTQLRCEAVTLFALASVLTTTSWALTPFRAATSSSPTDTLSSPLLDPYPSATPSLADVESRSLVPLRRLHQSRDSWRRRDPAPVRKADRWSDTIRRAEAERASEHTRWWVTTEPRVTLDTPSTGYTPSPHHTTQSNAYPDSLSKPTYGNKDPFKFGYVPPKKVPSRFRPRKPSATPTPIPTTPPPTYWSPHPPPTTLYEEPAVLPPPQDLLPYVPPRRPRWFSLDELFRMLTEGGGGQCVGGEGRVGVCMLRRNCHRLGGTPTSTCAFGYGNCCIAMRNDCGWEATRNRTYWSSPGPGSEVVTTGATCVLNVRKISNNICFIRLNFSRFSLTPPNEGNCLRDHLAVSGQNLNNFIPKLCGENSGQHLYIDVDTVPGPVELRINTVGIGFDREWEIEVTQIECNSPYRPSNNCLQYFTGSQGTFSTFNYVPNLPSQYLNNLNYATCIRKEAGFCSIVYTTTPTSATQSFELVNFVISPTGVATSVVPAGEAGTGLIQCPDDFVILAGTRLCGDRLNDGSAVPTRTDNGPVTDTTNGPFIVRFRSNGRNAGQGYQLSYQQIPC